MIKKSLYERLLASQMPGAMHYGPVEKFVANGEETAEVQRMLESDDDLERISAEVHTSGLFLSVFDVPHGYCAAIGSQDALRVASFRLGEEIDASQLNFPAAAVLGASFGHSRTKVEAICEALGNYLKANESDLDFAAKANSSGS